MRKYRSALIIQEKPQWASAYFQEGFYEGRVDLIPYDAQQGQQSQSARLQQAWFKLPFYDYCVFFVDLSSLVWARLCLAQLQGLAKTPIFLMVQGLSAPAIDDLLQLGAIDFFVHPVSPDEVRSRIRRHLRRLVEEPQCQELDNEVKLPQSYYLPAMPKSRGNALTLHEAAKKYQLLLSDGATLEAFSMAVATRFAGSSHGYQAIKGCVVASFERAFVHAMLSRTEGNISAAARLAGQHRRAFWGLMKKHNIDPQTYKDPDDSAASI